MNELIGKKITGMWVSNDQSILAFDTDQGVIAYDAWGDCCSETWFADITAAIQPIRDWLLRRADMPAPSLVRTGIGQQNCVSRHLSGRSAER